MRGLLLVSVVLVFFIWGCSDDRLSVLVGSQKLANEDFVSNTDSVFTLLEYKFQKIEYSKTSQNPITGSKGSLLYLPSINNFSNQDNQGVEAPIQIELLELLKPKDFILNDKFLGNATDVMSTLGVFCLKIVKDGQPIFLNLKSKSVFNLFLKSKNEGALNSFLGNENGMSWTPRTSGSIKDQFLIENLFDDDLSGYIFNVTDFNWIGFGKTLNFENVQLYPVNIVSNTIELEKIRAYLYIPSLKVIQKIEKDQSIELPLGTKTQLISFAFTTNKELYFSIKDFVIGKNNTHEVTLQASNIAIFEAELSNL
jgi:hypothetical protein